MPTYAYACTECEHRFETQQAFTDDALTECPECTGRLRKLFNAVGIVFKGSGFYRTDSRGKNGSSGSGSSSSSSSDTAAASSGAAKSGSDTGGGSTGSGNGSSGSSTTSAPAPAAAKTSAA